MVDKSKFFENWYSTHYYSYSFPYQNMDIDFYNYAKDYLLKNGKPLLRHPNEIKHKLYVLSQHNNLLALDNIPEKKFTDKIFNDYMNKTSFDLYLEGKSRLDLPQGYKTSLDLSEFIWSELELNEDFSKWDNDDFQDMLSNYLIYQTSRNQPINTKKELNDYLNTAAYINDETDGEYLPNLNYCIDNHPIQLASDLSIGMTTIFDEDNYHPYEGIQKDDSWYHNYIIVPESYGGMIMGTYISSLLTATFIQEELNNQNKNIAIEIDNNTYDEVGFISYECLDKLEYHGMFPVGLDGIGWNDPYDLNERLKIMKPDSLKSQNEEEEKLTREKEAEKKRKQIITIVSNEKGEIDFNFSHLKEIPFLWRRYVSSGNHPVLKNNDITNIKYDGDYIKTKPNYLGFQEIPHGFGTLIIEFSSVSGAPYPRAPKKNWASRIKYEGQFKMGFFHGIGKLFWGGVEKKYENPPHTYASDEKVFEGGFEDGIAKDLDEIF